MCLAIPLKVISIQDTLATVEMGGLQRQISLVLVPEARVGSYVLVHTGYAISILDEQEAQETLALFAEIEAANRQAQADVDQAAP